MQKNDLERYLKESDAAGKSRKVRTEGKGGGFYKTVAVGVLVILQLVLMLLLFLGISTAYRWYQPVAITLSVLCCIHVLSTNKTGHTKTVWVLFLMFFFYFGYIFYFFSNEWLFYGWAKRRYARIFSRTDGYTPEYGGVSGVSKAVERDCGFLWNTGKFAAYDNSSVKYFPLGAELFDEVLACLKSAERFIFIEFFIISDGVLFDRIFNVLSEKAAAGVDVRVICDGMGSHGTLSFKARKRLKKAGIKLHFYNRIVPYFTFALNIRDHRKIIVVDGKTAFCGGCNLADEYINAKRVHGFWKDSGLKVEGGAVSAFTLTFLRQWEFVAKEEEDYAPYLLSEGVEGDGVVVPYADGKEYECDICRGIYANIIASAQEKLYIMTPYFVPDEDTASLLAQKAVSGVDVRIILPEIPDKSYVYRVTVDNAERLLDSGVKIYKMRNAFVHSKIMLSENCAVVGSVNMDLRSFYNQLENAVYFNGAAMREVEADFEKTFKNCTEITTENATRNKLIPRIVAGVLRIFSPLM